MKAEEILQFLFVNDSSEEALFNSCDHQSAAPLAVLTTLLEQ